MTPTPAVPSLARTWWLVPIVLVAALAAAWLVTSRERPTYRARTSVVVVPNGVVVESVRDFIDGLGALDRRNVVATLARVIHSDDVVDRAAVQVAAPGFDQRRHVVRSIVLPNTNIVEIEVDGPSPDGCAQFAAAIASVAASETSSLYRIYRLKVLEAAVTPTRPVSPDAQRNLMVAGILGLVGGLLLAAGVEWARGLGRRS